MKTLNKKTIEKIWFEKLFYELGQDLLKGKTCENHNDRFSTFTKVFRYVLDKHAPLKTKTIRDNHAPVMTKNLGKANVNRSRLR